MKNTVSAKTSAKQKKFKPVFIVDLTEAETSADAMTAFAIARFEAGVPLTKEDMMIISKSMFNMGVNITSCVVCSEMCELCNQIEKKIAEKKAKKLPWYKRLWNRIKYAFNW